MKFIINSYILKNYKFFLVLFLFLSFYFKLEIFNKNYYNFYNDNHFYSYQIINLKNNLSEIIYNFFIFKNEYFKILHNLILFLNLIIPIYFIKRFELFFDTKLNFVNSCLFICIFALLPFMANTDIKFQISLFGFFLLILQFFKKDSNFFLIFFLTILLSFYPRLIISFVIFIVNISIIFLHKKKKVNYKFLLILFLSFIIVNLNLFFDLIKFISLNFYNQPQLNQEEIMNYFYVDTNPYFNDFKNFSILEIFIIYIISFISLNYINFTTFLNLSILFSFIFFLLFFINFKKYKFYNKLFIINLFIFSITLIILYNFFLVKFFILINPYIFIYSLIPFVLILLFLYLSLLKPINKKIYLIIILFISLNYLRFYFDTPNLFSECINNKSCVMHNYKKGGFLMEEKYIKLKDYLEKEKIENVFINKKNFDTKVEINQNVYFYLPIIFLSDKYTVSVVNNFNFKLLNIDDKKSAVLTLFAYNNLNNINSYKYLSKNHCISTFIIEDIFLCVLR
jgi:hypothetical protein